MRKTIIRLFGLLVAAIGCASAANAVTIDCSPGQLASLVGDNTDMTDLTITGTIDAADLNFIADKLTALNTLNMADATIEAYNGEPLASGLMAAKANTLDAYSLVGFKASSVILPSNLTAIAESALAGSDITDIVIPSTVTEIGNSAFADCASLTSVTIPASVVTIGNRVFSGCRALTSATVNAAVDTIPAEMFLNCSALTDVSLADNTTAIGASAFSGTTALEEFKFGKNIKYIGDRAFYLSGLKRVDLSKQPGLVIGDYTFARNLDLKSVILADNTVIGSGVFFDDAALSTISLPASLTAIPAFTFKGTSAINPGEAVPQTVTSIGDYALTGWDHVTEFNLPPDTRHIGTGAMEGWSSLETFNADRLSAVPTLGDDVWADTPQADIIMYVADKEMQEAFRSTPQWNEFKIIMRATSADQIDADINTSSIECFFEGKTLNIRSSGSDITAIAIYDLNGRNRYSRKANGTAVRVDASSWTPGAYIVSANLADGSHYSLKLILN